MKLKIIDLKRPDLSPKKSILSLGGFDGLHLGHQVLVKKLISVSKSKKSPSCLCVFDPLPFQVLNKEREFKRLFTLDELEHFLLKNFDLDFLYIIPFDRPFSKLSSKEFIQSVLIPYFDPLHIVVGYDFSFSHQKAGNFSVLQSYGKEFGFSVEKAEPYLYKSQPVSSSRIRQALSSANLKELKSLLGRSFSIQSQVLRGEGRGRKLTFPTANLKPDKKLLPPFGVYSGRAQIQQKYYSAIINIGCRPSFKGGQSLVEAHILDFTGDLYGQSLKLELENFIREERKFNRLSDLKEQIKQDIQTAFPK